VDIVAGKPSSNVSVKETTQLTPGLHTMIHW